MKWRKLGLIYEPRPIDDYLLTHASNPLAIYLKDDVFRIFFSGRDKKNRSSVGYVDIDIINRKIIDVCKSSIFNFSSKSSFYSHGVSIGTAYNLENSDYILFMGWQIKENEHWRGDIGRLRLINGSKLILDPELPVLTSDKEDPISLSYPCVIEDDGLYKMWYGSTISWTSENGEMIHVIKYATSKDGINWTKHGLAVPYEIGVAQAFSRPSVLKDNKGYHMWFSYRSGNGTKYRIGYAYSNNGLNWVRKEDVGIDVSKEGWDSEMICYPFIFDHKGHRYMLYNGNGYGKTGFGLAILEHG